MRLKDIWITLAAFVGALLLCLGIASIRAENASQTIYGNLITRTGQDMTNALLVLYDGHGNPRMVVWTNGTIDLYGPSNFPSRMQFFDTNDHWYGEIGVPNELGTNFSIILNPSPYATEGQVLGLNQFGQWTNLTISAVSGSTFVYAYTNGIWSGGGDSYNFETGTGVALIATNNPFNGFVDVYPTIDYDTFFQARATTNTTVNNSAMLWSSNIAANSSLLIHSGILMMVGSTNRAVWKIDGMWDRDSGDSQLMWAQYSIGTNPPGAVAYLSNYNNQAQLWVAGSTAQQSNNWIFKAFIESESNPGEYVSQAGTVQLYGFPYSEYENAETVTISVSRTGGSDGETTVDFYTEDNTALDGSDYTATNGTITWADGVTSVQTFDVPIIYDPEIEGNEYFWVYLTNLANSSWGSPTNASVQIVDEFTPDVYPGLVAWYDAMSETNIATNATRTYFWTDESGNNNNQINTEFTNNPTSTSRCPYYWDSLLNGLPVYQFGYVSSGTYLANKTTAIPQPLTVFMVASNVADSSNLRHWFCSGSNQVNKLYVRRTSDDTLLIYAGSTLDTDPVAPPTNSVVLYTFVFSNSVAAVRTNMALMASGACGANGLTNLSIGQYNYDYTAPGYISEMLFYSTNLSATQIGLIEQYLTNKWLVTW